MRLSKHTILATRTLFLLSVLPEGVRLQVKEIGNILGMSKTAMAHVIHSLGRSELIITTSGSNGGVELAKPLDKTSLADVVSAMKGELELVSYKDVPFPERVMLNFQTDVNRSTGAIMDMWQKLTLDQWVDKGAIKELKAAIREKGHPSL